MRSFLHLTWQVIAQIPPPQINTSNTIMPGLIANKNGNRIDAANAVIAITIIHMAPLMKYTRENITYFSIY